MTRDDGGADSAVETLGGGNAEWKLEHAVVSPRNGWPKNALDAIAVALALSAWLEEQCRDADARFLARYAEYKMRELGKACRIPPGQQPLTDEAAKAWLVALKINETRSMLSMMVESSRGEDPAFWGPHIARTATRLRELRRQLVPGISSTARPRARGAGRPRGRRVARASTRAGDSGDPDEPPGSRRCECGCGASLEGRRPQTRYANGDACRKRAERAAVRDLTRDRGDVILAELSALTVRGAIAAFQALDVNDRAAVVRALDLDDTERLKLIFAPDFDTPERGQLVDVDRGCGRKRLGAVA